MLGWPSLPQCVPLPGVAVRWPTVRWGTNLGGVRGAWALGQLMQLCDQCQEEVRVEAPCGTHAARHGQHLPKGASGLWSEQPPQAQTHCRCSGDIMDVWDSVKTLLPLAPVARLTRPLGLGNPPAVLAGVTYCQGLLLGSSHALQCP